MRRLYLLRHAKSSWRDSSLDDEARPLARHGREACTLMAKRHANQLRMVECCYCSSAQRAIETMEGFSAYDVFSHYSIDHAFYCFDGDELEHAIGQCDKAFSHIGVIGHNPAIAQLMARYVRNADGIAHFPTAALAVLESEAKSWADFFVCAPKLVSFDYPKNNRG